MTLKDFDGANNDRRQDEKGVQEHKSGQTFGNYRLIEKIGQGGMGTVWRALNMKTGRIIALKVISGSLTSSSDFARFRREQYLASKLQSPNLVAVHEFGQVGERLYIEMALIAGVDLANVIANSGPISPQRAVGVVSQIARALNKAHRAGLVHRDIKPSNVMLAVDEDATDQVYLIDFGLVRAREDWTLVSKANEIPGTLAYLAPECFRGVFDTRSDIYALGCVLFEMITGRKPYLLDHASTVVLQILGYAEAHADGTIPSASRLVPGLPTAIDRVIAKALAKNPAERYATALDLAKSARESLSLDGESKNKEPSPSEAATRSDDDLFRLGNQLEIRLPFVAGRSSEGDRIAPMSTRSVSSSAAGSGSHAAESYSNSNVSYESLVELWEDDQKPSLREMGQMRSLSLTIVPLCTAIVSSLQLNFLTDLDVLPISATSASLAILVGFLLLSVSPQRFYRDSLPVKIFTAGFFAAGIAYYVIITLAMAVSISWWSWIDWAKWPVAALLTFYITGSVGFLAAIVGVGSGIFRAYSAFLIGLSAITTAGLGIAAMFWQSSHSYWIEIPAAAAAPCAACIAVAAFLSSAKVMRMPNAWLRVKNLASGRPSPERPRSDVA